MTIQHVPESTAIDMIGPYLVEQAPYPFCGTQNLPLHTEGPLSPVKVHEVCKHIRGYGLDEDDNGFLQFEDADKE